MCSEVAAPAAVETPAETAVPTTQTKVEATKKGDVSQHIQCHE